MAIGAGIARHRASAGMEQERQAYESQQDQAQRQIEAQQQQKYQQPQQEDLTKKLQKYADLRQKGLLTEEEFQKLKADLLSQM